MKRFFALLFLGLCLLPARAQQPYPFTPVQPVSDTLFGTVYTDPYRWMENLKDSATIQWFKAQAAYTDNQLQQIEGRDALMRLMQEVDKIQTADIEERYYQAGRYFYKKRLPGEPVGKLYFREGENGPEQLLFDPAAYLPGKILTIKYCLPSYDGKKILIPYAENGSEQLTIRVMDVDSRRMLPDSIYPSWFGPMGWMFDNQHFSYFAQQTDDITDPNFSANAKGKIHRIGDHVARDIDFFSNERLPELKLPANELPFLIPSEQARGYLFTELYNVHAEFFIYYTPYPKAFEEKPEWRPLCLPQDSLAVALLYRDSTVYAFTHRGAPNYRLVRTPLQRPDWTHAATILPEDRNLGLQALAQNRHYLFITASDGINSVVLQFEPATGVLRKIKLPFPGIVKVECANADPDECFIGITSWTKPYTEFVYNAATGKFRPSFLLPAPVITRKVADIQSKEVTVKGHDGVDIPLTLIYRKGMVRNGRNVCFVESYGAYGFSMAPRFQNKYISLALNGVVVAVPHVRGGGEKGESWYKGGYQTTKPNTWKDFNSCVAYLIDHQYTRPDKVAASGTSAGGILISRAVTERPDLYGAVLCNVGCANAMRMEFSPNGQNNIAEFGTVQDSVQCRALFEMDGVMHVQRGVKYPAVLSVGGWHDPRVLPWQPAKFAAAVQQASVSGKPSLLKINYNNGHFTEDKAVTFSNFADQYAFALWQCGHPGFYLKKKP